MTLLEADCHIDRIERLGDQKDMVTSLASRPPMAGVGGEGTSRSTGGQSPLDFNSHQS